MDLCLSGQCLPGAMTEDPGASAFARKLKDVKAICVSRSSFAAIVGEDDAVVAWGDKDFGGDCSHVAGELKNVEGICATDTAFAALKRDGTVAWGDKGHDSSKVQGINGVVSIRSSVNAFAALRNDGTVVTWGIPGTAAASGGHLQRRWGLCPLRRDGTVVTWGTPDYDGGGDSSKVQSELRGVVAITATQTAFAALRKDGTVVTWGDEVYGGDSSRVQGDLTGVVSIASSQASFVAVRSDGRMIQWGEFFGKAPDLRNE